MTFRHVPDSPDVYLRRSRVAAALNELGFPVTVTTLETRATRGGGPPFKRFGSRAVLYRWGDALEWAHGMLEDA